MSRNLAEPSTSRQCPQRSGGQARAKRRRRRALSVTRQDMNRRRTASSPSPTRDPLASHRPEHTYGSHRADATQCTQHDRSRRLAPRSFWPTVLVRSFSATRVTNPGPVSSQASWSEDVSEPARVRQAPGPRLTLNAYGWLGTDHVLIRAWPEDVHLGGYTEAPQIYDLDVTTGMATRAVGVTSHPVNHTPSGSIRSSRRTC